jgi:Domain of unknown function (DUF397)
MTKERHPTLSGAQDQDGWFTSSFSSNANQCVEVRLDSKSVSIRDSKYRHNPANHPAQEPIITITTDHWTALLHQLTASRSRQTEQSARNVP